MWTEQALLYLQVLDELRQAASSARRPGCVWMLTATAQQLGELQATQSPAHRILQKWQPTKRFKPMDPDQATSDLVLTAVSPHLSLLILSRGNARLL